MSKKDAKSTQKPFSFLYEAFYPACALFAVIVFGSFTALFLLGYNVTEKRDIYISKQDDSIDEFTSEWKIGTEYSLSLAMLVGIFLFCLSVFALSYLRRIELDRISTRLLHFFGTILAFFIFILTFSGYISYDSTSFGSIALSLMLVAVIYFICVGAKAFFSFIFSKAKIISRHSDTHAFTAMIKRYIAPTIAIFAVSVIVCAVLAFFLPVNIKINEIKEWDPDAQRTLYESYETIITPLAPTLQNYLRYLGSAAVLVVGFSFFSIKLPAAARWALNFLVYLGGFTSIWLIQLDMFKELENIALYSVIAFLAMYLLFMIFRLIYSDIHKDDGEYEAQFSVHKHKTD